MSSEKHSPEGEDTERPLITHLIELRSRIMRVLGVVFVVFLGLYPIRDTLYAWLSGPLRAALPPGTQMIATQVATPFFIPLKLALVSAFFICIPYVLYQAWAFVAPGLYRHERRLIWPLLISSVMLFYAGMAFAYFAVFPLIFGFFAQATPPGVAMMTDISEYLSFVLTLFFAFGIAFEVPIATILLVRTGLVTRERLIEKRPYVIVGAFTVGMLLTPPDVVSQMLLAIPMWLLYEVGLIISAWIAPRPDSDADTLER